MWYRSLYWRIGFGFVALMAFLLGAQGLLLLWLTGQGGWLPGRSPTDLGRTIAAEVAAAVAASPPADVERQVRERFGRVYRPFVVVMADGRVITGRDAPPPPGMVRLARGRLRGVPPYEGRFRPDDGPSPPGGPGEQPPFGPPPGGRPPQAPGDGPRGELRDVMVPIEAGGRLVGIVVVAARGPQLWFLLQAFGWTLAAVGAALLLVGAAVASLVIFRPAQGRMRKLEEAAVAL
ncbi:MAG: hypothetical protein EHM24_33195, partial [Acidobacteria bacterium]